MAAKKATKKSSINHQKSKSVKQKVRRGGKNVKFKNLKNKSKMMIIGTNAAGLQNKKESFLRTIEKFQPALGKI